jgi:hypothetical protein
MLAIKDEGTVVVKWGILVTREEVLQGADEERSAAKRQTRHRMCICVY